MPVLMLHKMIVPVKTTTDDVLRALFVHEEGAVGGGVEGNTALLISW